MGKHLIILAFLGFFFCKAFAQTEIATTSHWYNRGFYNPASIARQGYIYGLADYRRQWVGIDGAPEVYNLQVSGYSDEYNSALGLSVIRDDIGLTTSLNPMLQFAHFVRLRKNLNLSLGISAGMYLRRINSEKFEAETINDPAINYITEKYSAPDANFGIELQSRHFLYGLSTTHLFSVWKPDDAFIVSNHRYIYVMYNTHESELLNFTTGLQVSNRRNLTVVQGTVIFRIKKPTGLVKGPSELFDIGITAYSVKEVTLITGINISENLRVGYTYDFNLGNMYNENSSHEVIIEYRIPLRKFSRNGNPWYN